jgi:hypothetical protein
MGVSLFIGGPGTGKTHHALGLAIADAEKSGRPLLVIDSAGVENFDRYFATVLTDPKAVVAAVWEGGGHARYIPEDEDDVSLVFKAARAGQEVIVIIDEVSFWIEGGAAPKELSKLVRTYRHARVAVYLTSQYFSDFPPWLRNCVTDAFIFRNEDARALEHIEKQWHFPPAVVAGLPDRHFLEWHYGQKMAGGPSTVDGVTVEGQAGKAGIHPGVEAAGVDDAPDGGVEDDAGPPGEAEDGKGGPGK